MKTRHSIDLPYILNQEAWETDMDGQHNDLLSGGSGFKGLRNKTAPAFSDPLNPTEQDIRKRAIWLNYRALMDVSAPFYGRDYGPGAGGHAPELIAGREIKALMDGGVTLMLQIPAHFDTQRPFLVTAPSSGSRGIYGGIGVVGEWALKRGYAVVYSDKGTGVGYHILDPDRICLMDGTFVPAGNAGPLSTFTATPLSGDSGKDFRRTHPHRVAVKHAHSGVNPQKDWGTFVLRSIEFARLILFRTFPEIRDTLKVLAAGISNGGLSAVMAAEQDTRGLIDAVVVSEPNVTPHYRKDLAIVHKNSPPFFGHSRHLADYITLFNLFQPCASLSPELDAAPFRFDAFGLSRAMCENRCRSLKDKGLLKGNSIGDLAQHALSIIRASGTIPDQEILLPSHYTLDVSRSISHTYVSQYGRFSVFDALCGYSFSAVDTNGSPCPLTPEEEARLFSDQSGIPPLGSIKLINDKDPTGPKEDRISVSPSTKRQDMNLDGALALRRLVSGTDDHGNALTAGEQALHLRVRSGMDGIRVTGNLKGRPALIVTGRNDAVLPVNHTSRPYVGVNGMVEKENSRLSYIEVTSAHHVDALNMLYANTETCDKPIHHLVPLQAYYFKALDRMVEHLSHGRPLPPSQVIRPEGPQNPLPEIEDEPDKGERIVVDEKRIIIP